MSLITLSFSERMAAAALAGRKCCTTRLSQKGDSGDWFEIDGETFRILDVLPAPLWSVHDTLYRLEGCTSPDDFECLWRSLHDGNYPSLRVCYVHFFLPFSTSSLGTSPSPFSPLLSLPEETARLKQASLSAEIILFGLTLLNDDEFAVLERHGTTRAARLAGDLGPDRYQDILARHFCQRSLREWGGDGMSVCRLCGHLLPPGVPGGRPDVWWCVRRQAMIPAQNVDRDYRRPKNCRYFRHVIIPCEHQHGLRCLAFYIDEEEHENAPIGLDRGRCTQWRDCQFFHRLDEVTF